MIKYRKEFFEWLSSVGELDKYEAALDISEEFIDQEYRIQTSDYISNLIYRFENLYGNIEDFENYLERLKTRRDEDQYPYTDGDFEKYIDYIKNCWKTNLSVYKCLEFMYFETREN